MADQSYLPRADRALLEWSANLSRGISPSPQLFGLSPVDAATLADEVDRFALALAAATTPHTRTPPAVIAKNTTREQLADVVRVLVRRVQSFPGITDQQRASLGLRIPAGRGGPILAPSAAPSLYLVAATDIRHILRIGDGPGRRPDGCVRPRGAVAAQVFACIGPERPIESDCWELKATATRPTVTICHRWTDGGQPVTFIARWVTRKGLTGPFSPGVRTRVLGGMSAAA